MTPDRAHISAIRVEADGTQRLWQFTSDGQQPQLLLNDIKPVGYHAWTDAQTLALFVLGQPATLQLADRRTGKAETLARNIGRSLQMIPLRGTVSFVEREPAADSTATLHIRELDPKTRAITPLVDAPAGSRDADLAWAPDGLLLMAKDDALYGWRRTDAASGWKRLADLGPLGLPLAASRYTRPAAPRARAARSDRKQVCQMRGLMSSVKRLLILTAIAAIATALRRSPRNQACDPRPPDLAVAQGAARDGNTVEQGHRGARHVHGVSGIGRHRGDHHHADASRLEESQASYLSNVGLTEVEEAFDVLGMPFFLRTDDDAGGPEKADADCRTAAAGQGPASARLGHRRLDPALLEEGAEDARRCEGREALTSKGDDKWVNWYVKNGFHPVELVPAEHSRAAQALHRADRHGAVPAVLASNYPDLPRRQVHARPAYLAAFRRAHHVERRLEQDSAEDRVKVTAAAQALEDNVYAPMPAAGRRLRQVDAERGLTVIKLDPKAAAEFRAAADALVATMRGEMVPADVFDLAVQTRDAVRKAKGK